MLFSSWLNTLLTLLAFYQVYLGGPPILSWAIIDANWVGTTRADCPKEGACWVFNRVIFMDKGEIVEQTAANDFFNNPQIDRTRLFLSQILH